MPHPAPYVYRWGLTGNRICRILVPSTDDGKQILRTSSRHVGPADSKSAGAAVKGSLGSSLRNHASAREGTLGVIGGERHVSHNVCSLCIQWRAPQGTIGSREISAKTI